MGPLTALDARLYVGAAGTTASTLLDTVGDVSVTDSYSESSFTPRIALMKYSYVGAQELEIQFALANNPNDVNLAFLNQCYINRTPIALLVLDNEGGSGWDGDWIIMSRPRPEQVGQVQIYTFTCKPTYVSRHMNWHFGT